ncbi:MAG: DedA family protein [Candidatus Portnoybacteria bacterium]|nr:DedA family protein [Candidatus Portnoybacteria bacterium]
MGEETLLIIGALVRLDYLDFWDSFFISFLGVLAGDYLWFLVGIKYGDKFISKYGRWFFMTSVRFKRIEQMMQKNGGLFIFISKFMYGLNRISLIAAGAIKFNFRQFIKYQLIASIVWTTLFMSLGYFFAHNLEKIKHDVKLLTIGLALIVVVFAILSKIAENLFEKKIMLFVNNDKSNGNHS